MKCKLSIIITSFVLCFTLVFAPTLTASAAVGAGSDWDGVISVTTDDSQDLFVYYTYQTREWTEDDGSTQEYDRFYLYEGKSTHIVEVESNSTDVYLNGYIQKRITVNADLSSITAEYNYRGNLDVSAVPVVLDNIYITVLPISSSPYHAIFDIYIHFDDYFVNHTDIQIPIIVDYSYALEMFMYQEKYLPPRLPLSFSASADYAGDIMQYDNLADVPSVDGYFAEQNQTIIDQSQTQNNLTTEQNTLIQNQTTQQHSDSQAQINQSIANSQNEINQSVQNTDKLANGYDDSEMNATSGKLDSSIGDLEDAEEVIVNFGKENIDAFTILSGGIIGVSDTLTTSISLVSSMLQSIFESAGAWNYVISLGFTLTLIAMVTGLFKYFKE